MLPFCVGLKAVLHFSISKSYATDVWTRWHWRIIYSKAVGISLRLSQSLRCGGLQFPFTEVNR